MYRLLGYINIALIVIITSPWWLRYLGKWFFPDKKIMSSMLVKILRVVHKILGVVFLGITVIHGYLALGALRLHTGTVTGTMLLITVSLGALFYWTKKRALFKWHKIAALITALLVILHVFVPSALYYIF